MPNGRGIGGAGALVAGVGLYVAGSVTGLLPEGWPLANAFEGGKSDPAPQGVVIYKGQEAKSISDRLLIDIGDGEALVAIKAKQNWDTSGGVFSGDFQSTNGTSFVSDPKHHGDPATLPVDMDYCSDGYIEVEKGDGDIVKKVTYHLGGIGVCGAHLDFGDSYVAGSFRQDDTPSDFHGNFVSFITNGVEDTALAAPCPTEELQKYQAPDAVAHFQEVLGRKFNVDPALVVIDVGQIAVTDGVDKMELSARLNSFANLQDPKDPNKTYPALNVQFITANASAIENSCYISPGGTDLADLPAADITLNPQLEAGG